MVNEVERHCQSFILIISIFSKNQEINHKRRVFKKRRSFETFSRRGLLSPNPISNDNGLSSMQGLSVKQACDLDVSSSLFLFLLRWFKKSVLPLYCVLRTKIMSFYPWYISQCLAHNGHLFNVYKISKYFTAILYCYILLIL